ncbi:PTS glucitol/sorbitol transporter subunit IIA [Lactiplantibacillus mudanjiangensis]|uniref:PTS glucose transporter subunit IIA [Lactobacillus sp.] n=1 Tax=Lactiplantibacillus mudanjiangensis TaxID=1296538 RepID=A0A660E3Z8_9LACO|nr:PTS glucitol/sorbitol transporter subunit IIA [Lactiplantibacillus mudanjiangensis]VDG20786.1 PTS glucose transporter subunit IIA [Lactobacillus sp.] [Lactiplantibacillus mudanjiangensis]VDG24479.1 PTS glucose transporter subunit IIA [Lactobacillus sp.] [Lactiplantibacillus mudanjiangensis]VDG30049.1 PTS glucose transporter subunit IIA [Lactobacillus sp.] [Lactiplantibacillus mudanjiangensis]VDG30536.1 PTS glucose transporter subunit IIA [Lactobacillus sp.] [Lactiplantibacillus mudanjiangens
MAITATVQSIGEQAISTNEPILIFFAAGATSAIQDVAIIQDFTTPMTDLTLKPGSLIKIDDQTYTVAYAGDLVQANLTSIGHATMYFTAVPDKPMQNGLYLSPATLPTIKVGSVITYQP